MSLVVLVFAYISAALTGSVLVASGMYGIAPSWVVDTCRENAFFCRYPYLLLIVLAGLLFLYRWLQQREGPDRRPWAKKLRQILD